MLRKFFKTKDHFQSRGFAVEAYAQAIQTLGHLTGLPTALSLSAAAVATRCILLPVAYQSAQVRYYLPVALHFFT